MGIINGLLGIVIEIFSGTFQILFSIFSGIFDKQKDHGYTAEFGEPSEQLSRRGNGFRVGFEYGNSLLDSNMHGIVLGGSGSGKSSIIGFPTLYQCHDTSYVVFDTSREYYKGTSAFLKSKGYEIDVLDFDDFENSIGFNCLDSCRKEADVHQAIRILFDNTYKEQRDYWILSAEKICALFALAIWKHAKNDYKNMVNVKNMVQVYSFAPEKIDAWILATGNNQIIKAYKSLVSAPEKTLLSTIGSALQMLALYELPNIAAISARSTFSFEEFRQRKKVLYIVGSPSSMRQGKIVSASLFEAFFDFILRKMPESHEQNITFIVDEAATMRLNLSQILELGRKARISVLTLWQDFEQAEAIYSKNIAANILANSRLKIYMPSGQPHSTCLTLSSLLGKYSFESENGVKTRELLSAQEVFQLDKILVLNGNKKPLLLQPKPFYESKKLLEYSKMPACPPTRGKLSADVPLIKF